MYNISKEFLFKYLVKFKVISKNLYFKKAKINFCNGYNLFIGVSMDFLL